MNLESVCRRAVRPNENVRDALPAEKKDRPRTRVWRTVVLDLLVLAVLVAAFALYQFVLPQPYAAVTPASSNASSIAGAAATAADVSPAGAGGAPASTGSAVIAAATATSVAATPTGAATAAATSAAATPTSAATATPNSTATAVTASDSSQDLGGGKFADKFTSGEVVSTATTYASANVNVTLSEVQKGGMTYYVEDVYIRNITDLRTAFAQDTYGKSIVDWPLNIAQQNDAIAAINGDYYGAGTIGAVIRNGTLYSARADGDVLVLFYDGTMKVYSQAAFNADEVMAAGAYQAWSFGPALLSEDGQALSGFRGGISGLNPRTAIGYYEPGHYVFVVVDGRQAGYSNGVSLDQLAALMEDLGVRVAYNLDGGKTSQMTFGDALVNQPTQGGRTTSDIIYIGE